MKVETNIFENILENIKDIDPEFSQVVDDNFWELIDTEVLDVAGTEN